MINLAESSCATRLRLSDCLARREREAEFGVLDNGRYRCRYVIWGRGPTLVLIPGLASQALSFVMLMARLQSHFRCISYDLPDGGSDGAHLRTYRHADYVSDFFALLDHLHIEQCVPYGASFGSTVVLNAVHQQPQRFTHGIVQGGFARRPFAPMEKLAAAFVRFLPGRVAHLPFAQSVLARHSRGPFLQREPEAWDFFIERSFSVSLPAFATRVLLVANTDLRPLLPAIQTPMLLVCGDRDPIVGKTCEEELMHGLPRHARAEIEECGHEPHLTHPEVLAEVLLQVLLPSHREASCQGT
jgi:3-oxoadipate enol-lactonase